MTSTNPESGSSAASIHSEQQLWNETNLNEGLDKWIPERLPAIVSTNTKPVAVGPENPGTGNERPSSADNSGNDALAGTCSSTEDFQRIFVPEDKYCGIWHDSPNKERHASFGDLGTTASASCFGDLMQMSQYLGVGHSGVFVVDQTATSEPYYVVPRACELDALASTFYGERFSFSLLWPYYYTPEGEDPPELRWVNWRWPRYQYSPTHAKVKACVQYMVREGVVLQQFTLENISDQPVDVGPFYIESTLLIRDLDFLDPRYGFNEASENDKDEYSYRLGPNGYGHICVRTLPDHGQNCKDSPRCEAHAVASVTTTFVNGKAISFDSQNPRASKFLEDHKLEGCDSGANRVEIVIARKLILLPNRPSDWRNFIIPAVDSDINHWLMEETRESWAENESLHSCFTRLPMTMPRDVNTGVAHDNDVEGTVEKIAPLESGQHGLNAKAEELSKYTDSRSSMPVGKPGSASDWNPTKHFEYFAWRHLEHILSVCAIPLSPPRLIEVGDSGLTLPDRGTSMSTKVALTCGDISGHRINTSASFFAFKFLVEVWRRLRVLETRHKTGYILQLETRISTTCSSHIEWLQWIRARKCNPPLPSAKRPPWNDEKITDQHIIASGCFAANYWVTGKVMNDAKTDSWQPQNRVTDTALQILKLAEYKAAVTNPEDACGKIAEELMNDVYVPWLTELDRLDVRKSCSWPHSSLDGIIKFRLDDHFWIWKALKRLDAVVTKIHLPPKQQRGDPKEILKVHKIWLSRLFAQPSAEGPPTQDEPTSTPGIDAEGDDGNSATSSNKTLESHIRSFMEISKRMSPNNLQRNVLQRFTAENDVLKPARRMLAVTRSATDMRFLLHARDTALFHGEGSDFFIPGSSFMKLWKNTIDAQLHHEENVYADSTNALRYGLSITMGVQDHETNSTSNAPGLFERSVNILIGASGSDAFFPGQLDEETREPAICADEEHRDNFYHAGFEINYILLSSANMIGNLSAGKNSRSADNSCGQDHPPVETVSNCHRQSSQAEASKIVAKRGANFQVISGTNNTVHVLDSQPRVILKKSLPFTNAIPTTNVNYIGDEWLYRYPDFLRGELFEDSIAQRIRTRAEEHSTNFTKMCDEILEEVESHNDSSGPEVEGKESTIALDVVDTRKGKKHLGNAGKLEKKSTRHPIYNFDDLCQKLREPRTAWTAKKRFVWLPHADTAAALACCIYTSGRERAELPRFFERHSLYTKDFLDETSMALNAWQTELHLSFYLLVDQYGSAEAGVGLPDWKNVPLVDPGAERDSFGAKQSKEGTSSGQKNWEIRRASMSFRFDGDFFDRFWTCHFIEHMPIRKFRGKWDHSFDVHEGNPEKQWSQRKVLELYFLERILEKMNVESSHFQDEIRKILKIEQGSLAFARPTSKVSMEDLQRFEKILELVEEDLTANLGTLHEKWDRRETDRGGEKPRWTRNDEAKYRTAINKFRVKVERAIGELQANRDDIRKLKGFLATAQKNRKDDMVRRRDERDRKRAEQDRERDARDRVRVERDRLRDADIRYFTYVTVIFQPLGFAASFYSMGGAPEPGLIVSLVEFSAAAFAVTLVLIWSYRAFASRNDDDGALKKFSRTSVENYTKTKKALEKDKNHKLSFEDVVHLSRGLFERIARYILTVLRWCWARVYERKGQGEFPGYPNDIENQQSSERQEAGLGERAEQPIVETMSGPRRAGQEERAQEGGKETETGVDAERPKRL